MDANLSVFFHNRRVRDRPDECRQTQVLYSPLGGLSHSHAAVVQSDCGYYGNSRRLQKALRLIISTHSCCYPHHGYYNPHILKNRRPNTAPYSCYVWNMLFVSWRRELYVGLKFHVNHEALRNDNRKFVAPDVAAVARLLKRTVVLVAGWLLSPSKGPALFAFCQIYANTLEVQELLLGKRVFSEWVCFTSGTTNARLAAHMWPVSRFSGDTTSMQIHIFHLQQLFHFSGKAPANYGIEISHFVS